MTPNHIYMYKKMHNYIIKHSSKKKLTKFKHLKCTYINSTKSVNIILCQLSTTFFGEKFKSYMSNTTTKQNQFLRKRHLLKNSLLLHSFY